MKRTLKGKNKVPPTKKIEPEDDSSNIETELSDPEDNLTVNYSGQSDDSNNSEPSVYPAKRLKEVKS